MGDYAALGNGDAFGWTASAAITGGQVLEVTGNGTVGPAEATSEKVIGVAAYDCASGSIVTVLDRDKIHVSTVSAAGAVTAGESVKTGAAGTVEAFTAGTDPTDALIGTFVVGGAANGTATWKGC